MKIATAIFALAALVSAKSYNAALTKDAALVYTNALCNGGPCADTNFNGATSYMAFLGNKDFRRILMSFDIPKEVKDTSKIKSCSLVLPQPLTSNSSPNYYNVYVRSLSSDFDPAKVTARNAPLSSDIVGQTTGDDLGPPPSVDVTSACQSALDGKVGLVIDANSSPLVLPSKAGGSNAHLVITTE